MYFLFDTVVSIRKYTVQSRQQPAEVVAKLLNADAAVKPSDGSPAPSPAAAANGSRQSSAVATQPHKQATEAHASCNGPAVHVETETNVEQEVASGQQSVSHSEEEEEGEEGGEQQREKGIRNATTRRRGAFRRGLVRCVMLMHDAFMADRAAQAGQSGGTPPAAAGKHSDQAGSSPIAMGKQVHFAGSGAAAEAVQSMLDDESAAGTTAACTTHPGHAVEPKAGTPQAPLPSLPEIKAPRQLQPPAALEAERMQAEPPAEDIPVLLPVPKRSRKAAKEQLAANQAEASQAQGFDPLREGCWHPQFKLAELSLDSITAAAVEAARKQAIAEQQGWRR